MAFSKIYSQSRKMFHKSGSLKFQTVSAGHAACTPSSGHTAGKRLTYPSTQRAHTFFLILTKETGDISLQYDTPRSPKVVCPLRAECK